MNVPKYTARSCTEHLRICKWLEMSGIPYTSTPSLLEIQIGCDGVSTPKPTTLAMLQAAPALFDALWLMLCWTGAVPPSQSKISPPTEAEAVQKAQLAIYKADPTEANARAALAPFFTSKGGGA